MKPNIDRDFINTYFGATETIERTGLIFPDDLTPNPGGQTKLFDLVSKKATDKVVYSFRGGLASGKSFSGSAFLLWRCFQDPDQRVLISANSYGQLETSTLISFLEVCRSFDNVRVEPYAEDLEINARQIAHRHSCYIIINEQKTFCYVLSAEVFTGKTAKSKEVGRGLQIRTFWGDEYAYAEEGAFTTLLTRLNRGVGFIEGLGLVTSTINKNNPFNWFYDFFDNPNRSQERQSRFESIQVSTAENAHLDPNYVEMMRSALTPELYDIEINSIYAVTTEGKIYKYFDRNHHSLLSDRIFAINTQLPLYVSIDFNYSPTCAIIAQKHDSELRILGEFYLKDAGTFELSRVLCDHLRGFPQKIFVCGDATGNQKTANSQQTNWQIINSGFKRAGLDSVRCYGKINPSVIDSINAVNVAFQNDKIIINERCHELIKDLESLRYDTKGSIDKSDINRSHLQDCLRYLVHHLFPLQYKKIPRQRSGDLGGIMV